MNVIDEAGVVLIHHGQLVPGRAHVQAAHGRGLLQQHDRQGVIHKDLQDLDRFETKSLQTFLSLEIGNSTAGKNFGAVQSVKLQAFSETNCNKIREMFPV